MNRYLLSSLLLFIVFSTGCATSPKIVGKWKVQPSSASEHLEIAQIFKDGTVLVMGAEDEKYILMQWSMAGDQIMVNFPEQDQFLVLLPDRNTMIWKCQKKGYDVVVFYRER